MSAATAQKRKWTAEEYLEMEGQSLDKHEFFDGEIFAMAGASPEHNLIMTDLLIALGLALRGKCRVYASDQRLFIPATGLYTYADASVLCGKADLTDDKPRSLRNPDLICEVLSESTESYDRGEKFENYRSLPSLSDYMLVSQNKVLVEHFVRQPDGSWLLRELRAGHKLRLPCGEIAVDDLYLQVGSLPAHTRQTR